MLTPNKTLEPWRVLENRENFAKEMKMRTQK